MRSYDTVPGKPWLTTEGKFLLFDFVHPLKCIRNNWITELTGELIYDDDNGITVLLVRSYFQKGLLKRPKKDQKKDQKKTKKKTKKRPKKKDQKKRPNFSEKEHQKKMIKINIF